jgi:hypothetical protein
MVNPMKTALILLFAAVAVSAQNTTPTIAARTAAFRKIPGYFPLYWDEKAGKMWLEIDKFDTGFLYVDSMPAGMGSNDLGLDRGQLGGSRIVRFMRSGPKVLMIEPNYRFRAIDGSPEERRSVEESFAQSVLWGFEVAAEEGGRALVDATQFFLRDAHHIPQSIQRAQPIGGGRAGGGRGEGGGGALYHLDPSRCAFYLENTKGFPRNTEVETILTFTGDNPNEFVRDVTPSPDAVTVREHHSFVELPGPGYKPRAFDPRAGYIGMTYADFIAPLGDRYIKHLIIRHRLQKKDPSAAISDPVAPIVYYLDRGAPEPIRSALLEGGNWWNQAFEAAGFSNAFRVELMPPGMDPMDVRYNVIQWVHRYTRGWSYGEAITDPRTGEIIKGQVTLGSLRGRQDYLIFESLLAPYEEGKPVPPEMERAVLARLRQLAAHGEALTFGSGRLIRRLCGGYRRLGQGRHRIWVQRVPGRRRRAEAAGRYHEPRHQGRPVVHQRRRCAARRERPSASPSLGFRLERRGRTEPPDAGARQGAGAVLRQKHSRGRPHEHAGRRAGARISAAPLSGRGRFQSGGRAVLYLRVARRRPEDG